ncbi:DNA ligase [Neptunomonas antarctica]|uniref:DNA ligase-1 n=1 Tax=Neptunomonas antarctica TaxID=619304 RepID=A0A1N7KXP4_9GAMM|nr:DNA ligase [Neptunomonas antarctica]SIS66321.1 DNA ligase-1 [Neptunomonas antarctica]
MYLSFKKSVIKKYCSENTTQKLLLSLPLLALGTFTACSAWATVSEISNIPPLQLAESLDPDELHIDLKGYWYAEKLDGVRGYWDGQQLLTRQGNPIHAPAWFTQALPTIAMEGELWIERQQFDRVSGIARSLQADEESWRAVKFYLFDLPHYPGTYEQRRAVLEKWVASMAQTHIQAVDILPFSSSRALEQQLTDWTAKGAEGVMLYRGAGLYQAKRTHDLLKLKGYEDAEAQVVEWLPGKGKYKGMLGALLVEDKEGMRFRIGSGFSDAERQAPPDIGSTITYRFNGKTRYGKPRFARFERIRLIE